MPPKLREPPVHRIRPAHRDDLDDLHEVHVAVVRDGRGVVRAEPWARETLEQRVGAYLEGGASSGTRGALLVVEVEGRVVGQLDLDRVAPPFCRHVATLGIEVHPDYQRRGLGRALMQAGVDWANAQGITRLELYVRSDNERAIALYEAMGFQLESVRARFLRLPDGTYLDDNVMVRFLD